MSDLATRFNSYVLPNLSPAIIWPVLCLIGIVCFFVYYTRSIAPRQGTLEWVALASAPLPKLSFTFQLHRMHRKDALPLIVLTAVYAATAFFQLGSFTNPQSFCQLSAGESATMALKEETVLTRIMYYPGLNTGSYTLEVSADGEAWFALRSGEDAASSVWIADAPAAPSLSQKYSEMFKWLEIQPAESIHVKFIRVTGHPDGGKEWLELGELALYDQDGRPISGDRIGYLDEKAQSLFDEQNVIPEFSSWYNSAYFDEIYHPRTAYENIRGVYPYEITHPPLGKLIMSLGIRAFGMTPFGWRFMGTLFGVGMVPILYIFLKNLFGKTAVATCGAALFAFDFMHLTQTRIGTIDTYGVFFILCMYFFLYRYLTLPAGTSFKKGALPLFLSGLMWGIGAASKWTVIYGAAGLAILYFIGLYFKWRDWPQEEGAPRFGPWLAKTLLFSVLCFVLIPAVIYTLSYLPYAQARGGLTLQVVIKEMLDNQKYMFTYHEGVNQVHPYSSRWYQWLVDGRPILYYLDNSRSAEGLKTAFGAFTNPLVTWGGLVAVLLCAAQAFRRRCSKIVFFALFGAAMLASCLFVDHIHWAYLILPVLLFAGLAAFAVCVFPKYSGRALFILVGYLSQLVPWMLIGRTTFAYHYFPSMLFLVLALAYLFNDLIERRARGWRVAVYGFTGVSAALYAVFYPVLIGLTVPSWYPADFLRWIPSAWPF